MEAVARTTAPARLRTWIQPQPRTLAAWALGFLPVVYLSLRGGGWDPVVRNEVGIAVWWIVLIAAALGLIPLARVRTMGWVALALFAAFAVWTALGIGWSESGERTFAELSRVLTYLGVFALALAAQGRNLARPAVAGVASAIGLVAFLAVLSRLHPAWFPPNHVQEVFAGSATWLPAPGSGDWNTAANWTAGGPPNVIGVVTFFRSEIFVRLFLVAKSLVTAMASASVAFDASSTVMPFGANFWRSWVTVSSTDRLPTVLSRKLR